MPITEKAIGLVMTFRLWVTKNKWWIIGIAAAIVVLYLLWPSAPIQTVDVKAIKEHSQQLEQNIKQKDIVIDALNKQDKIKTDVIDSLEGVIAKQELENTRLEATNEGVVAKYERAKLDKDTVEIMASCNDLKASLVKTQNSLRVTSINSGKVIRELKSQVKIKDELLSKANEKIDLLTMANKGLTTQNIDLGIRLNKSEQKRKGNNIIAKISTAVAAALAAIIIVK